MANVSKDNDKQFWKDFGLFSEVVVTAQKVGAGREFFSRLAHDQMFFEQIVSVMKGMSQFEHHNHKIDTHSLPNLPNYHVEEHKSLDVIIWSERHALLRGPEEGVDGLKYLNYNVMIALRDKPYLIPEHWRNCSILFPGTIFWERFESHGSRGDPPPRKGFPGMSINGNGEVTLVNAIWREHPGEQIRYACWKE